MATSKTKTWRQKLEKETPGYPKTVEIPLCIARTLGEGNMVILTPKIVDTYIKSIPKGSLATINSIRSTLLSNTERLPPAPLLRAYLPG